VYWRSHPGRGGAGLLLPGLVERRHDQALVVHVLGHEPPNHPHGPILVAHGVVEQSLHPIRRGIPRVLGQRPPVLRGRSLINPATYFPPGQTAPSARNTAPSARATQPDSTPPAHPPPWQPQPPHGFPASQHDHPEARHDQQGLSSPLTSQNHLSAAALLDAEAAAADLRRAERRFDTYGAWRCPPCPVCRSPPRRSNHRSR
jgi:hypothetical protein